MNARPVQPQNNREILIGQAPRDMEWLRQLLAQAAQAKIELVRAEEGVEKL